VLDPVLKDGMSIERLLVIAVRNVSSSPSKKP